MIKTYVIADWKLAGLNEAIAKLNKRARRLGVQEVTLTKTGVTSEEPVLNQLGERTGTMTFSEVELNGASPKFAGWQLAARIEHAEEGNILRKSPDVKEDLTEYRNCKAHCAHCNTLRNRRDTFVVIHEDGTRKQVGADCIKDFLGHKDPHQLAMMLELLSNAGDLCEGAEGDGDYFGGGGGGSVNLMYVRTFLAYVAAVRREKGFITGKQAQERDCDSTAYTAGFHMDPPKEFIRRGGRRITPTDEDKAFADTTQDWVIETLGAKDEASLSDFEHNMLTIARCESVEHRNKGLAAFLIEYRCRAIEQAEARKRETAGLVSKHYGEPKKRVRGIEMSYIKSHGFASQFGYTFIHIFMAATGERLVWKTGTQLDYQPGQKIKATFTVKKHSEFNGLLQTEITRVVPE